MITIFLPVGIRMVRTTDNFEIKSTGCYVRGQLIAEENLLLVQYEGQTWRVIGYIVRSMSNIHLFLRHSRVCGWRYATLDEGDPYLFIRFSEALEYARAYDGELVQMQTQ